MSNVGHKNNVQTKKFSLEYLTENDALEGPTLGVCLKIDQDLLSSFDCKVMKAKITSIFKYV